MDVYSGGDHQRSSYMCDDLKHRRGERHEQTLSLSLSQSQSPSLSPSPREMGRKSERSSEYDVQRADVPDRSASEHPAWDWTKYGVAGALMERDGRVSDWMATPHVIATERFIERFGRDGETSKTDLVWGWSSAAFGLAQLRASPNLAAVNSKPNRSQQSN